MAESLNITLDTVKKHVRNVIDKLQARSRTHAAIIAAQAGIVGNPITQIVQPQSENLMGYLRIILLNFRRQH